MTGFQLQTIGNSISFAYTCGTAVILYTDWARVATHSSPVAKFTDLSGLKVLCPEDHQALSEWWFSSNATGTAVSNATGTVGSITYLCASVATDGYLTCEARSTDMSDDGGGQNTYLARHNVQCGC